jgi:hypothetical protein
MKQAVFAYQQNVIITNKFLQHQHDRLDSKFGVRLHAVADIVPDMTITGLLLLTREEIGDANSSSRSTPVSQALE